GGRERQQWAGSGSLHEGREAAVRCGCDMSFALRQKRTSEKVSTLQITAQLQKVEASCCLRSKFKISLCHHSFF
ncbi:hypothetical protein, partial [Sulfitobacter sp.]|uniref:hypothetical protein n=1 Tax=Sulfitobacter sp. TaxID=1903071 RepID=UPI003001E0B3